MKSHTTIGIVAILALLLTSFASAQTSIFDCDFDTDSCGFDLAASGGLLNTTSSTQVDVALDTYTWWNVSMAVRAPTGGNGFKASATNSDVLFIDGACWKDEDGYSIGGGSGKCGFTLDDWVQTNLIYNSTSNTSQVCFGGSCSASGTGSFNIDPAATNFQFQTTYAGGDVVIDNMTIYVLDSEAPASGSTNCTYGGSGTFEINGSLCGTMGVSNNMLGNAVTLTGGAMTMNSSGAIYNFSSFMAYSNFMNHGGTIR